MTKKEITFEVFFWLVITILASVILFFTFYFIEIFTFKTLPMKEYDEKLYIYYNTVSPYNDCDEIRADLNKLFKCNNYTLTITKFEGSVAGDCNILLKSIRLDESVIHSHYTYTYTLAHELTHLTQRTANERWTEYNAIIKLYESGNEYFKNVAKRWAISVVNYERTEAYDCGWYLLEYFKGVICK